MQKMQQGAEIPDALLAHPITRTSHKKRYAVVYGQCVEYYERPDETRQKRHRDPVRVRNGMKERFRTKAEALVAAENWEASA